MVQGKELLLPGVCRRRLVWQGIKLLAGSTELIHGVGELVVEPLASEEVLWVTVVLPGILVTTAVDVVVTEAIEVLDVEGNGSRAGGESRDVPLLGQC